jgi:hypothetical protein
MLWARLSSERTSVSEQTDRECFSITTSRPTLAVANSRALVGSGPQAASARRRISTAVRLTATIGTIRLRNPAKT